MNYGAFLHFLGVCLAGSISSLGVSIGQAIAVSGVLNSIARQPAATTKLNKILFYGLFLIESSFVLAFLISFLIFFKPLDQITLASGLVDFGAALGIALSAIFVGLAAGITIKTAAGLLAKQPNQESKITLFVIVLLTLIETPTFFMFVVALLSLNHSQNLESLSEGYKLLGATLAMGIGSVGPSIAQIIFAKKMCSAVMHKMINFNRMFSFGIITEALIESCALFPFMIAVLLIFKKVDPALDSPYIGVVFLAIALCVSIASSFSAVSIANVGKAALDQIVQRIDIYEKVFQNACFSQVLIESCGLFAFIISLILMMRITF